MKVANWKAELRLALGIHIVERDLLTVTYLDELEAYKKAFKDKGLELKIRFFPMPGHKYSEREGCFKPVRNK